MSDYDNIFEDDELLDRLVDGELGREEYQQLLGSFEEHPEGWRRCALAFLEAQAFRKELSLVRNDQTACPRTEVAGQPVDRDFNWTPVLAVAASFLIAFALGLSFRWGWVDSGPPAAPNTVVEGGPNPASGESLPESAVAEGDRPARSVSEENITLVLDRGDGSLSESFVVPVIDWSPEHERLLREPGLHIPPEVQRMLQRSGRQLRTNHQLMPVRTEDGRQILVPVEQLEITPVNGPLYQ